MYGTVSVVRPDNFWGTDTCDNLKSFTDEPDLDRCTFECLRCQHGLVEVVKYK
jgi:hypothetical protein